MQTIAKLSYARISPLKARLVANRIRGLSVERAMYTLNFMPKKAAFLIKKVLASAIANAEQNHGADIDLLKVSRICIDEAGAYKRMMARAKGRGSRILKRLSHIHITLSDLQ